MSRNTDPNLRESRPTLLAPNAISAGVVDPENDARRIKNAFREPSQNVEEIIEILTHRVALQRRQIAKSYANLFRTELKEDIEGHYGGMFSKLVEVLLMSTSEFLAHEAKKKMAGLGTDEDLLTEILCTRTNETIRDVQKAYRKLFKKSMDDAVQTEYNLQSDYKNLLKMLLGGMRDEHSESDPEKAKSQAETIHNAAQNGLNNETEIFMTILTHEPYIQLRLIFDEYRLLSGHSIEETILKDFSGDLKTAMITIVRCAISRSQYYAEKLESCIQKWNFNDRTIIRIIVTRCEIDLQTIKDEYLRLYHKTLYHQIRAGTSGEYRDALLSLVGNP